MRGDLVSTTLFKYKLFEIFIFFFQKFNFELARKIIELFLVKTRENAAVWDFLAVDNFDFTRKIVKKIWGGKTRENVGVLSKLNFWTKI